MTDSPFPIDQVADTGTAVAVTDTPGTDAVADTGPHTDPSTHNHVGTRTT
ncbi:hypothetical protein OG216_08765 [Streptomycetaceae bacterium NBC_01309]